VSRQECRWSGGPVPRCKVGAVDLRALSGAVSCVVVVMVVVVVLFYLSRL
jgi:hypothetical protein